MLEDCSNPTQQARKGLYDCSDSLLGGAFRGTPPALKPLASSLHAGTSASAVAFDPFGKYNRQKDADRSQIRNEESPVDLPNQAGPVARGLVFVLAALEQLGQRFLQLPQLVQDPLQVWSVPPGSAAVALQRESAQRLKSADCLSLAVAKLIADLHWQQLGQRVPRGRIRHPLAPAGHSWRTIKSQKQIKVTPNTQPRATQVHPPAGTWVWNQRVHKEELCPGL